MSTKALPFSLLIYLLTLLSTASGQSISLSTLNTGGGTYNKGSYYFDWSIGEGVSIETFQSTRNLIVTSGILQPLTEKAGIQPYFTFAWASDELSVFPVPTRDILEVDVKIAEQGLVTMQVFDQRGRIILTSRFNFDGTNNKQKINLTGFAAGVYYMDVTMGGAAAHPIRKGTFKIQKL